MHGGSRGEDGESQDDTVVRRTSDAAGQQGRMSTQVAGGRVVERRVGPGPSWLER